MNTTRNRYINIIITNILTLQASIYFIKIDRSLSIVFFFSVDEIYCLVCKKLLFFLIVELYLNDAVREI